MGVLAILRLDRLQPRHGFPIEAFAGPAPNLLISGADIEYLVAGRGPHPKDFANIFRQLPKLFFADAECLFAPLARGDVRAEPDVAQEFAGRRKTRLGVRVQPTPLAVGTPEA